PKSPLKSARFWHFRGSMNLETKFPIQRLEPATHPDLLLWKIVRPPKRIYVQGQPSALSLLERLPDEGLAIIGTRRPQGRSIESTRQWIRQLRGFPLLILSGFAEGIDAVAHEEAIEV